MKKYMLFLLIAGFSFNTFADDASTIAKQAFNWFNPTSTISGEVTLSTLTRTSCPNNWSTVTIKAKKTANGKWIPYDDKQMNILYPVKCGGSSEE